MKLRSIELGALVLLLLLGLSLWLIYPVAPTFDTAYAIVWGHEILHGHLPTFAAYRAPTEHPLWLALGTLWAALGDDGGRVATLIGFASLVGLVAGLYRLARAAFGRGAAACACLLLLSRFHFAFYAAFAYLDLVYLALLVWAAALESERPRRGGPVWVALVLAGLLRPEAWLYALGYAAWLGREAPWLSRARMLAIVALPAAIWGLVDLIVTGHPTFSFTFTTGHAEQLARQRPALAVPSATVSGLADLMKFPVLLLAVAGVILAWRARLRESWTVLACALAGIVSFVITSLAGFAVVNRYLAFAAVALFCFAGWALAQAITLVVREARTLAPAALGVALVLLAGATWTAVHFHPGGAARELRLRVRIESQLQTLLVSEQGRSARRCGPVSVPNHKLVPLVRLDLHSPLAGVIARSDPDVANSARRGPAIVFTGGSRILYDAEYGPFGNGSRDPKSINDPPLTSRLARRTPYLVLYTPC